MVEQSRDLEKSQQPGFVAFTDLIFGARIRAAAEACGAGAAAMTAPERVLAAVGPGVRAVFVDLDVRAADPVALIGRLKAGEATRNTPIVAFASHLRTDALKAARAAGADRVLARGAFARQLPELVQEFTRDG